jgi:phosphoketolase
MDAYWRAANYLSVGQIYLQDNPLLEVPLKREHIKPRLLGHWGTTTGLNFIYVHLNRLIKENDLNMIYVIGPGHGGPGLVAHSYLEGSIRRPIRILSAAERDCDVFSGNSLGPMAFQVAEGLDGTKVR